VSTRDTSSAHILPTGLKESKMHHTGKQESSAAKMFNSKPLAITFYCCNKSLGDGQMLVLSNKDIHLLPFSVPQLIVILPQCLGKSIFDW